MAALSAIISKLQRLQNGSTGSWLVAPDSTNGIAITSSGNWNLGSWFQIQSSGTLSSHSLAAVCVGNASAQQFQIEIGTGAAGSEVVVWRGRVDIITTAGSYPVIPVTPPVQIPVNERVAARNATDAGSTTTTFRIATVFVPRPI